MKKPILAVFIGVLWTILAGENLLAATAEEQAALQKHVEQVKAKSPGKYQAMLQRAGGSITGCLSCHIEVADQFRKVGKH